MECHQTTFTGLLSPEAEAAAFAVSSPEAWPPLDVPHAAVISIMQDSSIMASDFLPNGFIFNNLSLFEIVNLYRKL